MAEYTLKNNRKFNNFMNSNYIFLSGSYKIVKIIKVRSEIYKLYLVYSNQIALLLPIQSLRT